MLLKQLAERMGVSPAQLDLELEMPCRMCRKMGGTEDWPCNVCGSLIRCEVKVKIRIVQK